MKTRVNDDGTTTVQAWSMTKKGKQSALVYDQKIALDWFEDGYDMQIVAVTRTKNGPRFEYGVVI